MQSDDRVDGTAKAKFHSPVFGTVRRGDVLRGCTVEYAKQLMGLGLADFTINNKPAGPSEKKPAGPGETKQGGAPVGKSSGAPALADNSPSSSAPGRGILSSSWVGVRHFFKATDFGALNRLGRT